MCEQVRLRDAEVLTKEEYFPGGEGGGGEGGKFEALLGPLDPRPKRRREIIL